MSGRSIYSTGFEPGVGTFGAVRETLLSWFEAHGRELPWRRTRDPWRVLVSEMMLQQIQVSRAIPFYEAFLARFPTLNALAESPLAEAIRTWGNLGRYKRVVNLYRTARTLVEKHGGKVPKFLRSLEWLAENKPKTKDAVSCLRRYRTGKTPSADPTRLANEIISVINNYICSGLRTRRKGARQIADHAHSPFGTGFQKGSE